jgi:tetratricopeptide (TPR) repeat protein
MCADCHSTNLEKNYDAASGEYRTTWSDIDVGCEACHGPGSTHVEWARKAEATPVDHTDTDKGLTVQLDERAGVAWNIDQAAGHAVRSKVLEKRVELDVCGRCHARREALSPEYRPGDRLLDHFRPSLLNQELYHADGQIDDEVYVYGSFLQSRMHAKGVTCSDCHEPHSLALRFEGNALCGQCHSAARFDSHKHHHHNPGETGGQCVNCHMPARNYMVVDARRDHSFRIPRPDLSVATGTPNACNLCHADEGAQWAQEKVTAWYGEQDRQHYATAFSAANHHRIDAEEALLRVAGDQGTPGIVRGTALGLLGNGITSRSLPVIRQVTRDSDPLVRMGAVNALVALPPQLRAEMGVPLLSDPLRVIRTETARQLAGIPADVFPVSSRDALESALAEYKSVQRFNADRPESLSSLANLALQEGEIDEAERLHEQAIELAPYYVPAYVNLADLYRARGDEARSSALLIEALKKNPQSGALYHALGLAQVRMGDAEAGTASLKRACDLAPAVARYAYVYAVALNSQGQSEQALRLLRETHVQFENDQDVLFMLAAIHRDRNELEQALQYADRLIRIAPDKPDVQALRRELRNRR